MNSFPTALSYILFGFAVFGFFVQGFGMILIVWRGGNMMGRALATLDVLGAEVAMLRANNADQRAREETMSSALSRVTALVDTLQRRVEHLAT